MLGTCLQIRRWQPAREGTPSSLCVRYICLHRVLCQVNFPCLRTRALDCCHRKAIQKQSRLAINIRSAVIVDKNTHPSFLNRMVSICLQNVSDVGEKSVSPGPGMLGAQMFQNFGAVLMSVDNSNTIVRAVRAARHSYIIEV